MADQLSSEEVLEYSDCYCACMSKSEQPQPGDIAGAQSPREPGKALLYEMQWMTPWS
jgi:hypothetical protein